MQQAITREENTMFVRLAIPAPYNGSEWRISKEVTGPRGGKHWEKIISQPATGGEYHTTLGEGRYKETVWTNGWASASIFTIEREEVMKDGSKWEVWTLTDEENQQVEEYLLEEAE